MTSNHNMDPDGNTQAALDATEVCQSQKKRFSRKNTKEERKTQKKRWKKRKKEKYEQQRWEKAELVQELQETKRLKREADVKVLEARGKVKALKQSLHHVGRLKARNAVPCLTVDRPLEVPQIDSADIVNETVEDKAPILGEGTFSVCAMKKYRGFSVAVKSIKRSSITKEAVIQEAALMMSLAHAGLPHLFGICTKAKPYLLVMQLHCLHQGHHIPCTLKKCLKSDWCHRELSGNDMARILYMIGDAVKYMHARGILHNDLKTNNIVLEERDGTGLSPVVIDFGKACLLEHGRTLNLNKTQRIEYLTNFRHIAPEVVNGHSKESESSDVYGFGVIIHEVAEVHNDYSHYQMIADKCMARWEIRPSIRFVQVELKQFVK